MVTATPGTAFPTLITGIGTATIIMADMGMMVITMAIPGMAATPITGVIPTTVAIMVITEAPVRAPAQVMGLPIGTSLGGRWVRTPDVLQGFPEIARSPRRAGSVARKWAVLPGRARSQCALAVSMGLAWPDPAEVLAEDARPAAATGNAGSFR